MADLPRVLFITSGLGLGGAERFLLSLLDRIHGVDIDAGVVSLSEPAILATQFQSIGVPVWRLDLGRVRDLLPTVHTIARISRTFRPDCLQGWMYHGNITATLVSRYLWRSARLAWSVRQSLPDIRWEKAGTRWMIRLGSRWSSSAELVIFNSETARRQHLEIGYSSSNSRVIDNGVDVTVFVPDPVARDSVRQELGWPPGVPVIGMIGRYHPVKGHGVFLDAARRMVVQRPDLHILLAGTGASLDNPELANQLAAPELRGRVAALGARQDIPRLMASLDVLCLSSFAEGFPNTVLEAMSCAVPVVATDVGDVSRILGKEGILAQPGDSGAMAMACMHLLSKGRTEMDRLGCSLRSRVEQHFSLDVASGRYAKFYTS